MLYLIATPSPKSTFADKIIRYHHSWWFILAPPKMQNLEFVNLKRATYMQPILVPLIHTV